MTLADTSCKWYTHTKYCEVEHRLRNPTNINGIPSPVLTLHNWLNGLTTSLCPIMVYQDLLYWPDWRATAKSSTHSGELGVTKDYMVAHSF